MKINSTHIKRPWTIIPQRLRQAIKIISAVLIVGFLLDLATVVGFSLTHPVVPGNVAAVVILGAKVGTPALTERTLTGLKYYQQGKTDALVLSGARGPDEPITEAQAMKNVIMAQLAKTHQQLPYMILDTRSTNTLQNLRNSRALIPDADSVVIVSDNYHLERAVLLARHVGFRNIYWNSPKPSYYSDIDLAQYYIREAVAMIAYLPQII